MEETIVWRQIQKINRTLRLHSLIGLALLLGLGCFQYRYLRNYFLGSQKIDSEQLLQIKDVGQIDRDFITFTSPKVVNTGIQVKIDGYGSHERYAKYALAIVGDGKVLLVQAKPDRNLQDPTFTGSLSTIPSDTQTQVVDRLVKERPNLKDKVLPFMLKIDKEEGSLPYVLLTILVGGLSTCIGIIYTIKLVTRNPHKHPIYTSLNRYGDPDSVANDIDCEINAQYNIQELEADTLYLTTQWLLFLETYNLKFIKLEELIWVVEINYFGKNGGDRRIALYGSSGRVLTIQLNEVEQVDRTIEKISEHAPWAIVGSSPEIKKMWDEQRNEFYLMVEQRRQKFKK